MPFVFAVHKGFMQVSAIVASAAVAEAARNRDKD
jgi:hypothetical protein